jgi:1-acyl-sn-glycerol-3-phosphate acyltransferase
LLYSLFKIYSRLAIKIYCRKIVLSNQQLLNSNGPLILAVNHPNSVLDAVILDTLFDKPVHSLARGDSFKKKWIAAILRALKMLPVYREREGKENLVRNYGTFDDCLEIFKKNGIVLIFTEALCENEWHLRPLKKGTARLAASAWQQGIPLKILPVGLNYSSFQLFSKNVHINIGKFIIQTDLANDLNDNGKLLNELTDLIECQLKKLVYEIDSADVKKQVEIFAIPVPQVKKILLALPALAGIITHCLLYVPIQKIVWQKAKDTGHYDSIITGLLFLLYPFYLVAWILISFSITGSWFSLLIFILFPFFAWSYVQLKQQTDN